MFPVRYEFGAYIPKDGILHSHRRENFKSSLGKEPIAVTTSKCIDVSQQAANEAMLTRTSHAQNNLLLHTRISVSYGIQLWGCASDSTLLNKVLKCIDNAPWYV
jgi:hypothetical protein